MTGAPLRGALDGTTGDPMANENSARPTKTERRQQAREQARLAREREQKREKRNKRLIQGSIVIGVLAVVAVIALVLTQTLKPAGPGPENMASGGAVFGADLEVQPSAALQPDQTREYPEVNREELPLDISLYVDYMCPGCGNFEQTYGTMLENYVGGGDATLRVYPLNFLDNRSQGTNYSTRAANMFGCLVEQQPDVAFAVHNRLLSAEVQPQEGTAGLTDDELLEQAELAGAEITPELESCVSDKRFSSFISSNTKAVTEQGLLGLAEGAQIAAGNQLIPADEPQTLSQTPTVIVNGEQWVQSRDGDLEAYLLKVKSEVEQQQLKNSQPDGSSESE